MLTNFSAHHANAQITANEYGLLGYFFIYNKLRNILVNRYRITIFSLYEAGAKHTVNDLQGEAIAGRQDIPQRNDLIGIEFRQHFLCR